MHKELYMGVYNIIQEATNKTIPKKKKCEKVKWLSEEALQIAEKGEREKYTQLNAEFEKKARRPSEMNCKEIQENNRMGKIL